MNVEGPEPGIRLMAGSRPAGVPGPSWSDRGVSTVATAGAPRAPSWAQRTRPKTVGSVGVAGPAGRVTAGTGDLLPSEAELTRLRQVAVGEEEADFIVRGGRVVAVHSGEVVERDILIVGRYIAAVTKPGALTGRRALDAAGRYVLPAYIDAGIRIEQTLLSPGELARLVIPRGTVTLLVDPGPLARLCGQPGAELATRTTTPIRVLARVGHGQGDAHGQAHGHGQRGGEGQGAGEDHGGVDGHGGLDGHGSVDGHGVGVLPRQPEPIDLITRSEEPERPADPTVVRPRTVTELATIGHVDHDVRLAVSRGMSQVEAIRRATLLPARAHGLERVLGSVAPSRLADLQVVSSLTGAAPPDVVVAGGRIAAEHGRPIFDNLDTSPAWARGRIRLPANLHAGSFTSPGLRQSGRRDTSIAVMSIENPRGEEAGTVGGLAGAPRTLRMAGAGSEQAPAPRRRWEIRTVRLEPTVRAGSVVADPTRDLLKIAILDRDGCPDGVEVGILRGLGLVRGALAVTTVRAPGHLVAVGARDDDMLTAVRAVEGMGGGYAVVDRGWVRAACPLSLVGVMSDAPWEAVLGELAAVDTAAADLGCRLPFPLRTLADVGGSLYTRP